MQIFITDLQIYSYWPNQNPQLPLRWKSHNVDILVIESVAQMYFYQMRMLKNFSNNPGISCSLLSFAE